MELAHILIFTLLFAGVSSVREEPKSSCSSKIHEILHFRRTKGLDLVLHHRRSRCSPIPYAGDITFRTVLVQDSSRVESITGRLSSGNYPKSSHTNARAWEFSQELSNVHLPLTPGTAVSVGNYVTKLGLGTPAVDYIMVVDTGSSLNWLQCDPCVVSCHPQSGPIFNTSDSSTYKKVSCSASACAALRSATLNPSSCTRSGVCVYEASYGDNSFSVGYLSEDVLSVSGRELLRDFIYGCGQDNEGLFGLSAGLIGLARHNLSLLSQLAPRLGQSFSYCLPSDSGDGALSFGDYYTAGFSFTSMVTSSVDDSLYFVRLSDIVVDKKSLPVDTSLYGSTPTIIDSGTVITRLPTAVYAGLSKAVAAAMGGYKKAPSFSILDTCYVGRVKGVRVPEVRLVFEGGAAMQLPPENVMIDVEENTTCLAFAPAGKVAIIGNRQQQTFSVVYDVARAKIGFAAGGCG